MLTRAMKQLLDFIVAYQSENDGVSPSYDEMKDAVGLASKSGIARLVNQLRERGYIRSPYYRPRSIEVISLSGDNLERRLLRQVIDASRARDDTAFWSAIREAEVHIEAADHLAREAG